MKKVTLFLSFIALSVTASASEPKFIGDVMNRVGFEWSNFSNRAELTKQLKAWLLENKAQVSVDQCMNLAGKVKDHEIGVLCHTQLSAGSTLNACLNVTDKVYGDANYSGSQEEAVNSVCTNHFVSFLSDSFSKCEVRRHLNRWGYKFQCNSQGEYESVGTDELTGEYGSPKNQLTVEQWNEIASTHRRPVDAK